MTRRARVIRLIIIPVLVLATIAPFSRPTSEGPLYSSGEKPNTGKYALGEIIEIFPVTVFPFHPSTLPENPLPWFM